MDIDIEDLKSFAKKQVAAEADSLTHWDVTFWSERLRESKYDINEVLVLILKITLFFKLLTFISHSCILCRKNCDPTFHCQRLWMGFSV